MPYQSVTDAKAYAVRGLLAAIVKHIAQLHGGEVSVASSPGGGAVFRLVI